MRTSSLTDPFTKVFCMRIEPRFGSANIYLTSYPTSLYVSDGVTKTEYLAEFGTEHSDFDSNASFTPGVIELKGVLGQAGITREKLMRGDLEGARIYIFATTWTNPVVDEEPLGVFMFGKPKITDDNFKLDMVHIIDSFNATPSLTYAKTCSNTFGDTTPDGETVPLSYCRVGTAADLEAGSITAYDPAEPNVFTDSTKTGGIYVDDWFGAGYVQFLINGYYSKPFEVKSFTGGVFTLFETPLYDIDVATDYRARAGCRKRLVDCRDKFDNMLGSGGTEGGFLGFDGIPTGQQSGKIGNF